jgi:hypothetical protein
LRTSWRTIAASSSPAAPPATSSASAPSIPRPPRDDLLAGGSGTDTLKGGQDSDTLAGEAGDDLLMGGTGHDVLDGALGSDELYGDDGEDALDGGTGADTLWGGAGDDTLSGADANDVVDGGAGDDRVSGGLGDDMLSGGSGYDTIDGGSGHDQLFGGDGSDTLTGGPEVDYIDGASDYDAAGRLLRQEINFDDSSRTLDGFDHIKAGPLKEFHERYDPASRMTYELRKYYSAVEGHYSETEKLWDFTSVEWKYQQFDRDHLGRPTKQIYTYDDDSWIEWEWDQGASMHGTRTERISTPSDVRPSNPSSTTTRRSPNGAGTPPRC